MFNDNDYVSVKDTINVKYHLLRRSAKGEHYKRTFNNCKNDYNIYEPTFLTENFVNFFWATNITHL